MSDNRKRLETVALDAVQRNGLKGLSFRTLAEEIGIKSSSVHYHFPEKSDLARTLIERYSEAFFSQLGEISSQKWGLKRKLSAFIAIFEQVSEEDKLCLCGMVASEVEQLNNENHLLLKAYFRNTEQWLAELFEQHCDELNTSLSATNLAKCVLSGLEGALLLDRVMEDKRRLKAQKELYIGFIG